MNKQILSDLSNNPKKLYYVVNRIFSIKELMGENKLKGIFCPFHNDKGKPSSRFYIEPELDKLWCFTEGKSYFSYHYIKLILKEDPFKYLLKHSKEEEIAFYINDYNNKVDEEEIPTYKINELSDLDEYFNTQDSSIDYSKWYLVTS